MCNRQLHDTNHYQMTYSLVPSYYILQTNLIDPPMIHQFVSVWPRQPRLIIEPPFFLSFVQIIQIMQNRRSEHAEAIEMGAPGIFGVARQWRASWQEMAPACHL